MGRPFNKYPTSRRGGGSSFRGRGRGRGGHTGGTVLKTLTEGTRDDDRLDDARVWDELDEKLGFPKFQEGASRQGWLVNMKEVRTGLARV